MLKRTKLYKNAFTLIELLVVISIIAVLMAIMMPALAKVREMAKRTICKTNQHDLGNAVFSYTSDFDGKLIPAFTAFTGNPHKRGSEATWHLEDNEVGSGAYSTKLAFKLRIHIARYFMDGYGIEAQSWVCPSLKTQKANLPAGIKNYIYDNTEGGFWFWPSNQAYPDGFFIGYVNIMNLYNMRNAFPNDVKESPRKIYESGNKHLLADLNMKWADGTTDQNGIWQAGHSVAPHRAKDGSPAGGNRLYLDGHIDWIKPETMGYMDEPLSRSEGKFDHAPSAVRDCYW